MAKTETKVLERAGLIERGIDEQRRPARLKAERMLTAVGWLADFRPMWGTSFDQLDEVLIQMKNGSSFQKAIFLEVSKPNKLLWHLCSVDSEWNILANPMMPDWPR